MKTKYSSPNRSAGYALMLVLVMCAISLVIIAGIMFRTSTVSKLNDRNNKFNQCNIVAGAATEKVFARMAYDFQNYGLGQVTNNLAIYRTNVPTAAENPYWGKFVYSDTLGNVGKTFVDYVTNYVGLLPSQYTNLATTLAPVYRIVSNVSMVDAPDIIGTSQEDVLLSLVPITTYAIFYNGPLEFTKCADMIVRGRTHANDIICVGTSASLNFKGVVTSTKTVTGPTRDGWTPSPWNQNTTFSAGYVTNVPSVTVAMTMTNSHAIIDMPPNGEAVNSLMGQLRLYNQAHIIIVITNDPAVGTKPPTPKITITVQTSINGLLPGLDTSKNVYNYIYTNLNPAVSNFIAAGYFFTNYNIGVYTNQPPDDDIASFLSITNRFTDKREYQTNFYVTQIDLARFATWLTTPYIASKFSGAIYPTILYVADTRKINNKLTAVRLVNGARLPYNNGRGFSVATPNPLYVKGNYNVTADGTHYALLPDSTTNNGTCVPAALLCDAITILSSSFSDATSGSAASGASSSNVLNAAVITGNVPSTGTSDTTFSGGVHNLMRMLEDWNGDVLVLNTSIVVLYASNKATNQFRNPIGWSPAPVNPYYKPPTRQWGFDPNFYDPAKQPPGVPSALVPIRFNWTQPPAGTH
jgi:hypothetical protein